MAKFPFNPASALAYAWVQAQDLSDKTPEQVEVLYRDAYNRIVKKQRTAKEDSEGFYHYDD